MKKGNQNEAKVFEGHFYFWGLDEVKACSKLKANWINVVRDPIDKFVSAFFFVGRKFE